MLTVNVTVVNVRSGCAPVGNASVEIWQCDADGRYSEYAQGNFDGRGGEAATAYCSARLPVKGATPMP